MKQGGKSKVVLNNAEGGQHFRFDLKSFVPYRVSILATLIRHALSEIYREDPGLTEPEWKVFTTLAHMGPLPSGDIGLHMTLDRMAISRALGRLISLKLVGRTPLKTDGRMWEVGLTPHGSRVFDLLARKAAAIEKEILSPLKQEEVKLFLDLVDRMEMNFRNRTKTRRPKLIAGAKAISLDACNEARPPDTLKIDRDPRRDKRVRKTNAL